MALLRLLVVEDDAPSLSLMTELLQQLHTEVVPIGDSPLAAKIIEQEKFDGIFLDLTMPILTGYDLAMQARESSFNKTTPIVIVTGRDEVDTMHKSFSHGATYFLHKPFSKEDLEKLVDDFRGAGTSNRRQFTRVPLNGEITYSLRAETLRGFVWNISQGGIQLEAGALRLGDRVHLSFLMDHIAVAGDAMVVWVRDDRRGLIFTRMSVEDQEAIRLYVARAGS
jgi:CheY-like chemotaxis protein